MGLTSQYLRMVKLEVEKLTLCMGLHKTLVLYQECLKKSLSLLKVNRIL
jgi:hypothetical protein